MTINVALSQHAFELLQELAGNMPYGAFIASEARAELTTLENVAQVLFTADQEEFVDQTATQLVPMEFSDEDMSLLSQVQQIYCLSMQKAIAFLIYDRAETKGFV